MFPYKMFNKITLIKTLKLILKGFTGKTHLIAVKLIDHLSGALAG